MAAPAAGCHFQILAGGFLAAASGGDYRQRRLTDKFLPVKEVGQPVQHPFQGSGDLAGIDRRSKDDPVRGQQLFFQRYQIIMAGTVLLPFLKTLVASAAFFYVVIL